MNAIKEAVKILRKGGVVIYPTESSYALGCDATNLRAIRRIHKLKGRKSGKYFPIIVSDIKMAKRYYFVDKKIEKIANLGVTIVTKKRRLSKYIGGFRISKSAVARKLSKSLGKPIIATSANISGKKSMYKINEIRKVFSGKADVVLNAGNLPKRKPSTVYDYENKRILRKGPVSLRAIEKTLS